MNDISTEDLLCAVSLNADFQKLVFGLRPRSEIHTGRYSIVPSLAAVLVIAAGQKRSYHAPVDFVFFLPYTCQRKPTQVT